MRRTKWRRNLPFPRIANIRFLDQLIRLTGVQAQKDCPCLLRRVVVWDPVNQREIALLTNLIAFGATTIAAIYKDRWEIELFFKALKQNPQSEELRGDQRKRPAHPDLDSLDRHPAAEMAAPFCRRPNGPWSNLASMLRLNLFTYS